MFLNTTFIQEVGPLQWTVRYARRQWSKRVLQKDSVLRLPTGLSIFLPPYSASATEVFVTNANIDWGAEEIFARFADPRRDFLDVGAHIGYYSVYLAPRVRNVYAFEPDPRNLPSLRRNAAQAANMNIVEMAASSSNGTATFHVGQGSEVGTLNDAAGPVIEVRTTTVDFFLAAHPDIEVGLVKTDAEGYDLEILKGMEATIAKYQPVVLTECTDKQPLWDVCRQWEYGIFAFVRGEQPAKKHFRELDREELERQTYKMLFLVPPRLFVPFRELVNGSR